MPDISIIVTTLNAEQKIPFLLDSVNRQTNQNFEIIIVDGGSTDNTVDIIKGSRKKINLLIVNGSSIYEGINHGVRACETEYYVVAGSDDIFVPDAIDRISKDLGLHKEVDLFLYPVKVNGLVLNPRSVSAYRKILGWQSIISSHSVGTVIKTELHKKLGFYDTKYAILADGYFLTEALNSTQQIRNSKHLIGEFSSDGISNRHFYNNIFTTFLIQVEFYNFFIQLLLLCFRLIKYRRNCD